MEKEREQEKRNRILKIALIILAVLLAGETAYLIGLKSKSESQEKILARQTQRVPKDLQPPAQAGRGQSQKDFAGPGDSHFFQDEWDPFAELQRMQENMNRLFRDSFRRATAFTPAQAGGQFFEPDLDFEDRKDHYLIKLDLPGMDKDKIKIDVTENALRVSGERQEMREEKNQQDGFYRMERSLGSFSRQVPLPDDVNPEQVTAQYEKGVLTVKLQKKQGAAAEKGGKQVQIQ